MVNDFTLWGGGGKHKCILLTLLQQECVEGVLDALFTVEGAYFAFLSGYLTHFALRLCTHLICFVDLNLQRIERVVYTFAYGLAHSVHLLVKFPEYFVADVYDANEKGAVRKKIDMKAASADATNPRAGMINFASAGITVTKVTSEAGTAIQDPSTSDGWTYAEIKSAVESYGGQKVFITYTQPVQKSELIVSGDTFPGTYYITGDTYARSDVTGKDSFFQFIIPKAKMSAEQTITLEAEGDPTTFNMNLTVLRPESGDMMKLVQYDLESSAG